MALRVRDDPYEKAFRKNISNGETDSIESDRTFVGHILCKLGRQLDFQSRVCAFLVEGNNAGHAIDVTLHEMSAEPSLDRQSALQIHRIVSAQFLQVGASDCFFEKIEGETIAAPRSQREAAAIHGDAVAAPCLFRSPRRGNLQLSAAIARAHLNDLADFFDQAGEHDDPLLKSDLAMKRASLVKGTSCGQCDLSLSFRDHQVGFFPVPAITESELERRRIALREELLQFGLKMLFEELDGAEIGAEEAQTPFVSIEISHRNSRVVLHNAVAMFENEIADRCETLFEHQIR